MAWSIRHPSRRSPQSVRFSNPSRPRRRLAEPLEPRWLLASDAYVEFNLASNQPGTALVTDPSLGYAWGIATSPGASGGFSVSDTLVNRSNSYSGDVAGSPFVANAGQTVFVPLATGQVYNGNANEFIVHSSNPPPDGTPPIKGGPAEFIYASLDGSIYGFNPNIGQHAVPAVSVPGAAFTGLTLATSGTANNGDQLYAADFLGGKIDVFNSSFQPVTTSGSFTDPNLPSEYKPFDIQALGGELYVSYAAWAATPLSATAGGAMIPTPAPGGVVDVFDVNGNLVGRIASGSPLDQPWGMALAPQSFGQFAGNLLVANHGDGKINVFSPTPSTAATAGTSLGTLSGADGNPFVIDGLFGLAFGNGDNAGDSGSLYFTAGSLPFLLTPLPGDNSAPISSAIPTQGFSHGLVGTIQVAATNPLVAVGTNTTAHAGDQFTGALAAFGSADSISPTATPLASTTTSPVASYTATIDWGDGSSATAGTIVPTGNGGYLVVGSHTYSAAGTDDYTVTINDASSNSATATGTVQVTPATLLAHALPVKSDGLVVDNAEVATFVDTGGADPLSNYSATIDWGDGSSSAGTITNGTVPPGATAVDGFFNVAGSYTYTATGDYTFTVTISDTDGSQATVTGTAEVAQASLVAKALPVHSDGLTVNNANVAAFTDTGGADPLSNYSATIDWGDGSSSTGTITNGTVPPGATAVDGFFNVAGSHTYTATGDYTFTVTISDTDGGQATVTGTAEVTQASLVARALPVQSDGLTVNNANVAGFIDTGGADPLANYSATIDWGDGSSSTGTISSGILPADSTVLGGFFTVAGSHTYTATGDYTFTVTISDTDGGQATVTGTAEVSQASLVAHTLPVESEGLTVNNANVATFFDTGGADPLSNYSATIDWGDGSSSTGTITAGVVPDVIVVGGKPPAQSFFVSGSHTYAASGDYTFTVAISDTDGSSATVTGTVSATTPTLEATAMPVTSQGLIVDNQTVADFVDTGGPDPLSNYTATIDWGDNSTSAGTIHELVADPAPGAPFVGVFFQVSGSHTYTAAGDYTFTVTIDDSDGTSATVTGTASVATPTLEAKALPVYSPSPTLTNTAVADFIDTGGADPLTNYSATIDWGDGSSSTGTVNSLPTPADAVTTGGFFSVSGSHTYAATGDYTFTVAISDTDGANATVTGTAHIAHAPLLAVGVPVVVNSGLSVNGAIVAAFADGDGGDPLANYSATIDWGDGSSSSAGTVTGSGNSFVVTGSHTYAAAGDYDLKIAISDQDGSSANPVSHAFIDAPVASFVANAFENVLHRAPDDTGLSYWNQQIAGGLTTGQFASDLTHSAEFYATNVIDPDYQKYLGRASDSAGLAYWTGQMQQGMTDQQIEANFIASDEFYAHSGGTNADWVNAMYQVVLGRQADTAGLNYWLAQLASGASRSSVAMGFAGSQEREAEVIQNDYFTFLGRSAGQTEVNYWVDQFDQGVTNEDIVSGFVGSSEYFKSHS
jgi:uncharacterized protein (TIGR03118 family)